MASAVGKREVPYSVVTALDSGLAPAREDGITLNEWAARELGAKVGDPATLEYYVWGSDARLHTETAQFRVERIVPLAGDAADPDFAPDYPGITESRSLRDWDPPFPLDLARIRPADEQYWNRYRTTPKAFIRLARGRAAMGDALRQPDFDPRLPAVPGLWRGAAHRARPRAGGSDGRPGENTEPGGGAGRNRFRRVLRLLQLLPDGLGPAAHGIVLQARNRTADARNRRAARARVFGIEDPDPVPARRRCARGCRFRGRGCSGAGLRRAHPAGAAHLVVRRGGNPAAFSARLDSVAGHRGRRRDDRGPRFRGVDPARPARGYAPRLAGG